MLLASGVPTGFGLFIPPWSEVVISAICLVPIAFVCVKVAVPAFLRTLDERTARIKGGLEQAEAAAAQIAAERAKWRDELVKVQAEAAEEREQARREGEAIIARMKREAHEEAERILAAAQAQIDADAKAAAVKLRGDVGDLATKLAGKIIGEAMTDSAVAGRVIDRFLDDLEASQAGAAAKGGSA
jgi:F-type H+-transporting ATPase subunit b